MPSRIVGMAAGAVVGLAGVLLLQGQPLNLLGIRGAVDEAQGPGALGARVVVVAVQGSNRLGDMVARV